MKHIEEKDIAAFNEWREESLGLEYNRANMLKILKERLRYPSSDRFLTMLSSGPNPPIVKSRHDVYRVSQSPVFRDRLQRVFEEYHDVIMKIPVEEAVYVLKEHGYKIWAPKIEYIEL